MTFTELLIACSCGKMPFVTCKFVPRHATSAAGVVTTIKDNGRWKGCAVQFPGINYDTWFADSDAPDRRSHYMRDLILCDHPLHAREKGNHCGICGAYLQS
jgi:hypothetical protein